MHNLTSEEKAELNAKKYLDSDGHPSLEAYKQVFTSPSADFSPLAISVEKHGRDCPVCGDRYNAALDQLYGKQK
jgi:hypothetical protein